MRGVRGREGVEWWGWVRSCPYEARAPAPSGQECPRGCWPAPLRWLGGSNDRWGTCLSERWRGGARFRRALIQAPTRAPQWVAPNARFVFAQTRLTGTQQPWIRVELV